MASEMSVLSLSHAMSHIINSQRSALYHSTSAKDEKMTKIFMEVRNILSIGPMCGGKYVENDN